MNDTDWEECDKKSFKYVLSIPKDDLKANPLFKTRSGPESSIENLFLQMIDEDIIREVRDAAEAADPNIWKYGKYRSVPRSIGFFLQILAVEIRIFALQNKPSESDRSRKHPQRDAIVEAREHFRDEICEDNRGVLPQIDTCKAAIARFIISHEHFGSVFRKVQSMFLHVGDQAAGDEKLNHFTGNSRDIMMVPSKPDKIGFWNYELCVTLKNGSPFCLLLRHKVCGDEAYESTCI